MKRIEDFGGGWKISQAAGKSRRFYLSTKDLNPLPVVCKTPYINDSVVCSRRPREELYLFWAMPLFVWSIHLDEF